MLMNPPYDCETSLEESLPGGSILGVRLSGEDVFGEICAGEDFSSDGMLAGTRFSAVAETGKTSKTMRKSRELTALCINGIVI